MIVSRLVHICTLVVSLVVGLDVLDYVDPLIGTANGGHVFPGATLPFGMAKAVADTTRDNQGGFASDSSKVTGFSHVHDSGTGGAASLGNFPLFPQDCPELTKCAWESSKRASNWTNATARPGYFGIELDNGIRAEMTVTNHTALYRFEFANSTNPLILVDLIDLPISRSKGFAAVDSSTGRMTGNGTFSPSFGIGHYNLYFCADFQGAEIHGTGAWQKENASTIKSNISVAGEGSGGVFVRFKKPATDSRTVITARVGISFISIQKACHYGEEEQPGFDLKETVGAAEMAWRAKLGVVSVNTAGASDGLLKSFWSGLYRAMISPQDYTGENPLWDSDEPYYDSFYCIWDSYRAAHPLLTLVDPLSQSRMIRSLVDIYRNEDYLPDCRMSLCKGYTQGGSNADVLMTEAYLKRIPDIDWDTAFEAVVKDAEVEPANWDVEGRGGLNSWKTLGYIPKNNNDTLGTGLKTRSVSRTVEYAYNDFCIAILAKALGHDSDHKKYRQRASNWQNLYNSNQTSSIGNVKTNFTGFLQPRLANGAWAYQDPILCSPLLDFTGCYLTDTGHETYEGSAWMYTFYVPQDMAALIKTLGGSKEFVSRLDFLHESGLLYMGDEQAFLPVYQYHYAGRPALSARRAHSYIPSQFNTSVSGIPGNDDSGAMGSFLVLSMIGLWPIHGQDVYLINPPFFKEVSIRNGITGKLATIRNVNFDASYRNIFIQSVRRDGAKWTKNWIGHDFFLEGGILEIILGERESTWGSKHEDFPPSMSL
ncbi:hypothetical protein ASPZODRAFT_16995 [Penicilliopsis zonata CBS 506.65]|uniref:Glycosyl hydrolase family 92 domain-containing protein n=1 Tax=Penicilliopsis zonata CBS 506.65 TaxID=1073090 RepID=A0A1L9SEL0_9EURO|nr:hypothetical protein ASPZODRAFT_16995 [Penicilliopsis zonata CBS 506.65]OJJ45543.1 hypothetical protein ASPZODRAFT_16995 [Penicilliopsis zonata CBS 506.65]